MKWVLILTIFYMGKGVAVTTQEFDSEQACIHAYKVSNSAGPALASYHYACVPK